MKKDDVAVVLLFLKVFYNAEAASYVYGTNIQLQCTLNIHFNKYEWHKRTATGHTILEDSEEKYTGASTRTLMIISINWADKGDYRCRGNALNSEQDGAWFSFDVTAWTPWFAWMECSVSCGTGVHIRTRNCVIGNCNGDVEDSKECIINCKVDGGWSSWNTWGACNVTCGTGQRRRGRLCDTPLPANGGVSCHGEEYEYQSCGLSACPVDGKWSLWDPWEACNVTCGTGQQRRKRYCNRPVPSNNGTFCQGAEHEYQNCAFIACPVHGGWSIWDQWEACAVTCGTGQQKRRRQCNNPLPENSGNICQGVDYDDKSCSLTACSESNTKGDQVAPIAGGVGGGFVLLVLVIIGLIYLKRRRRRKPLDDRVSGENKALQIVDRNVSLRQGEDRQEGMYINIARASRQSSSDTDNEIPSRVSTKDTSTDESNKYCNNSDLLTTVKIEELKDYIKQKQINEGLQTEYKTIPYGAQHPTTIAQKKENMPKNRFKTTFPYDHTRVILQPVPGSPHTDYINANLVDGFEKESCYIASQGNMKYLCCNRKSKTTLHYFK